MTVRRDLTTSDMARLRTYSAQALEGEPVDVERIADTVRDYLGDIFACTRVWEAWQRGRLGDV